VFPRIRERIGAYVVADVDAVSSNERPAESFSFGGRERVERNARSIARYQSLHVHILSRDEHRDSSQSAPAKKASLTGSPTATSHRYCP